VVLLPARPLNLRFPLLRKLFLLLRDLRPVFDRLLRVFALLAVGTELFESLSLDHPRVFDECFALFILGPFLAPQSLSFLSL
jgi:hypothetical protein